MKDYTSWYGGALKPELQPVWARYFSRHLRPAAARIEATHDVEGLIVAAVENSDGRIAVVIFNQGTAEQSFDLGLAGRSARRSIPGVALQTVLIE